jgi:hypothetical protein
MPVGMNAKKHKQAREGEAKAKPEMTKLGLDRHARQVTECRNWTTQHQSTKAGAVVEIVESNPRLRSSR